MGRNSAIILNSKKRANTIKKILQGQSDDQIAKGLGVNTASFKGYYNRNLLPKRKDILTFAIKECLKQFNSYYDGAEVKITTLVYVLNTNGVYNQCGNRWSYSNLRSFFQKNGYHTQNHKVNTQLFIGNELDFYDTFSVSELRLSFDRWVVTLDIEENTQVLPQKIKSTFLQTTEIGIREAISGGARTNADITNYLNSKGYRNKVGKEFGRWSVVGIMERLCIQVPVEKKDWGNAEKQYLIGKISAFSKHKQIPVGALNDWANELDTDTVQITDKNGLVLSVTHLRIRHNKIVKNQKFYKEWFPKIDFAVNVTFRHKAVSRKELADHFDISTMTIQRYLKMLDYNVHHQYFLRFKVLYTSYLEQTKGEDWSATLCAEWFNKTYLKSERGSDWTYLIVQLSIDKLYKLEDEGLYG